MDAPQELSIPEAFQGRTVLLTGATGFVGSVVLEQLLRTCPDVHKVFVLVRPKRGATPQERIQQLLFRSPLFHLLRAPQPSENSHELVFDSNGGAEEEHGFEHGCGDVPNQALAAKVEAIPGDITLPRLGIGESDMLKLQAEVEVVIHAAASISFDDHIHDAITHNYMAGQNLADMACQMPHLKAFVHVSTAYVNGNQPKGSTVPERLLPLEDGQGQVVDHAALLASLQSLPRAEAAIQAAAYMQQWKFPNTYCFSKRLAEAMLAGRHSPAFPLAIVRPSIIGALSGGPLPGYVGNTAGSTGAALAIATGIAAWTCHQPGSVFDLVPADLVSSAILAAAARTMQVGSRQAQPSIVHACTSTQNPLTTGQFFHHIQHYFTQHPPPFRLILGPYPKYEGWNIVHSMHIMRLRSAMAEAKFRGLSFMLEVAGKQRLAKKLYAGWKAWQKYNSPPLDFDLCFETTSSKQMQGALSHSQASLFKLTWQEEDWQRYLHTYMAGVQHQIFRQPVPADAEQHDFQPWQRQLSPQSAKQTQTGSN